MIRAARLLAAILPLAGLAALWAQSDQTYRQGTEWDVPIRGYDPRDVLRGHYVEFTYDWPGYDAIAAPASALCLQGTAPALAKVTVLAEGEACAHPVRAGEEAVYGLGGLMNGRLYVGQARAAALQEQLRDGDQRGIVTIRQREDGSFTPIAIRFRAMTPVERAARDAPVVPAAPPIMIEDK